MKYLSLLPFCMTAVLLLSAPAVNAEDNNENVTVSKNQMISIELPDKTWEQDMDEDLITILFTDGTNEIHVDLYDVDEEIPYIVPQGSCETVYATTYMTKEFVVVSEALCYEDDEDVFLQMCEAVNSIKINKSVAKKELGIAVPEQQELQPEQKKTEGITQVSDDTPKRTGNSTMIVDDDNNVIVIYELSNGTWCDDNGAIYHGGTYNQDGYFNREADGVEFRIASDRGNNVPDYVVYGESGVARELYDNGDGTATDGYGNPYQYAGDGGWIDYYGNHYYVDGYRDDYARNDYGEEYPDENDYSEDGYIYTNGEYVTSVDGITRYIYWQNEFFAVDDDGNEYIFSGYDGSFRSSDGLEFN